MNEYLEDDKFKDKYDANNNTTSRWDFMEGFESGGLPSTVPESEDEAAEVLVKGKLPFVLLLPEKHPYDDGPLKLFVQSSKYLCELQFQRHIASNNYSGLQIAIEDRRGEYTFSTFFARIICKDSKSFNIEDMLRKDDGDKNKNIADVCVEILKKVLVAYQNSWDIDASRYPDSLKGSCDKSWIPELDRSSLAPYKDIYVVSKTGKIIHSTGVFDCRGTGSALGNVLSENGLRHIQLFMKSEISKGLWGYRTTARRLFYNNEFDSYIVILSAIFEKEVFQMLREKLRKDSKSESEIDEIMTTKKKRRGEGGFQRISLWKAVNIITSGEKYECWSEFQDVSSNLYALRDEIIHGDSIFINLEQAVLARDSCFEFMRRLRRSFIS